MKNRDKNKLEDKLIELEDRFEKAMKEIKLNLKELYEEE